MGLAVRKALPIAVAAALMCPPLAAKHAQVKPIRSADIKGPTACVALQLVLAGPLYSEAEKSEAEKLYGTVGRFSECALRKDRPPSFRVGDDAIS
jgi:hypothetical protein